MISKRILGFLLLTFIASLIYAYLQTPKQERITTRDEKLSQRPPVSVNKATGKEVNANGGYPRLRIDLLERKPQPYPGVRRNLFLSGFSASQEVEEELVEALPEQTSVVIAPPVVTPVIAPPEPPPPSPQDVARQELSQYKFIGFFKKREKRTIFLSSGGEVFLVRKGDYLGRDRKYFVKNITDTSLELRKEGIGDISIKLTDQESLSMVSIQEQRKQDSAPSSPSPDQELNLPDQPLPEFLPVPGEEPNIGEQLKPEEDN